MDLDGEDDVVGALEEQRVATLDEFGVDERRHQATAGNRTTDHGNVRQVPVVVVVHGPCGGDVEDHGTDARVRVLRGLGPALLGHATDVVGLTPHDALAVLRAHAFAGQSSVRETSRSHAP